MFPLTDIFVINDGVPVELGRWQPQAQGKTPERQQMTSRRRIGGTLRSTKLPASFLQQRKWNLCNCALVDPSTPSPQPLPGK